MNISILKSIENEMIKNNLTSFSVDRAINQKERKASATMRYMYLH